MPLAVLESPNRRIAESKIRETGQVKKTTEILAIGHRALAQAC